MTIMTLQEYHKRLEEDTKDEQFSNLQRVLYGSDALYCKWSIWLSYEKLALNSFEREYSCLYKEKRDFYVDGHTPETLKAGWELPPKGCVLKTESSIYINADSDILKLKTKMAIAEEKVRFIKDSMEKLKFRGKLCQTILDDEKYRNASH